MATNKIIIWHTGPCQVFKQEKHGACGGFNRQHSGLVLSLYLFSGLTLEMQLQPLGRLFALISSPLLDSPLPKEARAVVLREPIFHQIKKYSRGGKVLQEKKSQACSLFIGFPQRSEREQIVHEDFNLTYNKQKVMINKLELVSE